MRQRWLLIVAALVVLGVGLVVAQERVFGDWYVVNSKDAFDDTNRSYAYTLPFDYYTSVDSVNLNIACLADGLNVFVDWERFFGGDLDDRVQVRYRFDELPASDVQLWSMFTGNESAWMPMHLIEDFVAQAMVSAKILIRVVDPLDNDTITSENSLIGFAQALNAILPCD